MIIVPNASFFKYYSLLLYDFFIYNKYILSEGRVKPVNRELNLSTTIFALFVYLIWGGNVVSIKFGLEGLPPVAMAGIRFIIGGLCIFLWCKISSIPLRMERGELKYHLLNALFFMIQLSLLYVGMVYTIASHASILINTNPFFVALFAHFFIRGDSISPRKLTGFLLAFIGIIFIFYDKQSMATFSVKGDSLVFLSAFLLGLRLIYIKRLLESISPFKVVFFEFLFGVPLFFMVSFIWEGSTPYNLTLPVILAVLYQGVIVAGFCFVASTILLQRHHASTMSSFSFAIPVSGVLLSHLMLGDAITKNLVFGATLVIYGIYIVTTYRVKAQNSKITFL